MEKMKKYYVLRNKQEYRELLKASGGGVWEGPFGKYSPKRRIFTSTRDAELYRYWSNRSSLEEDYKHIDVKVDSNDYGVFAVLADSSFVDGENKGGYHWTLTTSGEIEVLYEADTSGVASNLEYMATMLFDSLISECVDGCLSFVQDEIEGGANPRGRNDYALQVAAKNGHIDIVKFLVEECGCDVNKNLPAKEALFLGHLHVAKYLISKGASLGTSFPEYILADLDPDSIDFLHSNGYIDDNKLDEITKIKSFDVARGMNKALNKTVN